MICFLRWCWQVLTIIREERRVVPVDPWEPWHYGVLDNEDIDRLLAGRPRRDG